VSQTISQEMLAVIHRAAGSLDPALRGQLADFLRRQWLPEGAARGRGGAADLYYSVFQLACCQGLGLPAAPLTAGYLRGFATGAGLDFVHRICLARCRGLLPETRGETAVNQQIFHGLEQFRCPDGGYERSAVGAGAPVAPPARSGSIYDGFLALLAYEESGLAMPRFGDFQRWAGQLAAAGSHSPAGSEVWAGATPVVAAGLVLWSRLGCPVPAAAARFLRDRLHPCGGFLAAAGTPMPDLLSTATGLHALAAIRQPLAQGRQACLEFVESLWAEGGGFGGHLADHEVDSEYTFYGLLALGHLLA
jgi:hypothetical protein